MGPELKFQKHIISRLNRVLGGWWFEVPRTAYGKAGRPDIIGCCSGHFVAIEVKRPDGKGNYGATPAQKRNIENIEWNGGYAKVISSEGELNAALRELLELVQLRSGADRP